MREGLFFLKRLLRVLGIFLIFALAAGAMWFIQSGKWKTTTLKDVYISKPQGDTLWVVNGQEREEYTVKGAVREKTYEGIADLEVRGKCVRKIVCKPDKAKVVEQKEEIPETIRVLLTTTDFAAKEHDEVKIRSEKPFVVKTGEKEKRCEGGEEFCVRAADMGEETIKINSTEEAKLEITSIKRGERTPSYRGTLELKKSGEKIRVINELLLEQYLYGVLPSEMPAEYPEAALRAQAVCARSYAKKQKQNDRLKEYDAQVDDSVAYQVYQSQPEDERANKAVDDTKGLVVCSGNTLASTYFFATSCGVTTSSDSVAFSDREIPYLAGQVQSTDISDEKKAERDRLAADTYAEDALFCEFLEKDQEVLEKEEPWFRWNTTISLEQMEKNINERLADRCEKTPDRIEVRKGEGIYEKRRVENIGKLKRVIIKKRGCGGVAQTAIIVGTEATIRVTSEYNIRMLLFSGEAVIQRKDGKEVTGLSMLPSGFFVLKRVGGTYEIKGGGYGHGVGMSQTGARQLANLGKNEQEIICHYFPGVSILSMSQIGS